MNPVGFVSALLSAYNYFRQYMDVLGANTAVDADGWWQEFYCSDVCRIQSNPDNGTYFLGGAL